MTEGQAEPDQTSGRDTPRERELAALARLSEPNLHRLSRATILEKAVLIETYVKAAILDYFNVEPHIRSILHQRIIDRLTLDIRLKILDDIQQDSRIWEPKNLLAGSAVPNPRPRPDAPDMRIVADIRKVIELRNQIAHGTLILEGKYQVANQVFTPKRTHQLPSYEALSEMLRKCNGILQYLSDLSFRINLMRKRAREPGQAGADQG